MKKIISGLLAVVMLVCLASVNVMADTGTKPYMLLLKDDGKVFKCVTQYNVSNYSKIEELTPGEGDLAGLTYENDKWILEDFTFNSSEASGIYFDTDASIEIKGTVTVSGIDFGIFCVGNMQVSGNGTLNLRNTSDENFEMYGNAERPCAFYASASFKVKDTKINAIGISGGIDGNPINIEGDALIKATGSKSAILSYGNAPSSENSMFGNVNYNTFKNMKETETVGNNSPIIVDSYADSYYFVTLKDTGKVAKSVTMISDKMYLVNLNHTEKGTITVSEEVASADDAITVKVKPSAGYKLYELKYNDGEDHVLTVKSNKATFKMPANDVLVSAVFKKDTGKQSDDADNDQESNGGTADNNQSNGTAETGDSSKPILSLVIMGLMLLTMTSCFTVKVRRKENK